MSEATVKIVAVLSAYDKMTSVINSTFANAQRKMEKLDKVKNGLNNIGNQAMITGGVISAFFGKTANDAMESVKASNRLDQVFKSMGEKTNKASLQAQNFASNLQFKIGIEDEQIMAAQAKLATFKRVSDATARSTGIFDRATAAAFDMQATGYGDALSNVTQLGKALQNPALGAAALSKAGAINKEDMPQIKMLQATKGVAAAQEYLLRAIEKQVKGVAEATANPLDKMKIGFSEISESIGKSLLPSLNEFANKMSKYIPKIIEFVEKHKALVLMAAKAGIGLLGLGVALKTVSFFLGTTAKAVNSFISISKGLATVSKFIAANPIILAIAAIGAAAYLIYKHWDKIKAFFKTLWDSVSQIFTKVWDWIKNAFLNFTPLGQIIKHWKPISKFFAAIWDVVKAVFGLAFRAIKYILIKFTPVGLIIKYWDKISGFFSGIWDKVKSIFSSVFNWIKGKFDGIVSFVFGIGKKFYDAGANIINSIIGGIGSKIKAVTEKIKGVAEKIRNFFPFSPAKEGPLKDIHRVKIVETIAQSIRPNALINKMQAVTKKVIDIGFNGAINISPLTNKMQAVAKNIKGNSFNIGSAGHTKESMQFVVNVHLSGSATKEDATMIGIYAKKQFERMFDEYQNKKSRLSFG